MSTITKLERLKERKYRMVINLDCNCFKMKHDADAVKKLHLKPALTGAA